MAAVFPCDHGYPLGSCMLCAEEAGRRFWEKQPIAVDPRNAELATLRAQLAEAIKVVDAARKYLGRDMGDWDETALDHSVRDYDAKHGKTGNEAT